MASPAPLEMPPLPLRFRAARAACAIHGKGSATVTCEMGQQITDNVLAEVRAWLLEIAERRQALAVEYGPASPLGVLAAGDLGPVRELADLVGEGIPGLENHDANQ